MTNSRGKTQPIFIVSSGRSGTQMMDKLFSTSAKVESHHEYMIYHLKPLIVKYRSGLVSKAELIEKLRSTYASSIHYSLKPIWIDSSFFLSWIVPVLIEVFPGAKFVHLVRDGRKVVSSFYHKLGDEIYDDRSTKITAEWLKDQKKIAPPPEKKYWWFVPIKNPALYSKFKNWSQFERICFHWSDVNEQALAGLAKMPTAQKHFVKLEQIASDEEALKRLVKFIGIQYKKEFFQLLQRPHNVNKPEDYPLTKDELAKFKAIAWGTMKVLGYDDKEEYRVSY